MWLDFTLVLRLFVTTPCPSAGWFPRSRSPSKLPRWHCHPKSVLMQVNCQKQPWGCGMLHRLAWSCPFSGLRQLNRVQVPATADTVTPNGIDRTQTVDARPPVLQYHSLPMLRTWSGKKNNYFFRLALIGFYRIPNYLSQNWIQFACDLCRFQRTSCFFFCTAALNRLSV